MQEGEKGLSRFVILFARIGSGKLRDDRQPTEWRVDIVGMISPADDVGDEQDALVEEIFHSVGKHL